MDTPTYQHTGNVYGHAKRQYTFLRADADPQWGWFKDQYGETRIPLSDMEEVK